MAASRPGVSSIVRPPTSNKEIITAAVPQVSLTSQAYRAVVALAGMVNLHLLVDKTGSMAVHVATYMAAWAEFAAKIKSTPGLRDKVRICMTEMSSLVESSGYQPATAFEPVDLPVGGGSPHGQMIKVAIEEDEKFITDSKDTNIQVVIADWCSSDDVVGPIKQYRKHQSKFQGGVHVFPVCMGGFCDLDTAGTVSTKYEVCTDSVDAFQKVFTQIFEMVEEASKNPASLNSFRSLSEKEILDIRNKKKS
jgi:hypothetical protein